MMGGGHIFFAESLDTFVQDLQRANPTVFLSVPRLYLKFQLGVFKKMPAKKLDLFLKIPILSGIVKKKVLSGLGLQSVRLAGCGSARSSTANFNNMRPQCALQAEDRRRSSPLRFSPHLRRSGRQKPARGIFYLE